MTTYGSTYPSQDILSGNNNFLDASATTDACNVTRYVMGVNVPASYTLSVPFETRSTFVNKQAVYITVTFVAAYEDGGVTQYAKFKRGAFLANGNTIASAVNQTIDSDVGSDAGSPPAGMSASIVWNTANRVNFNLVTNAHVTYWTIYVEAVEVTSAA